MGNFEGPLIEAVEKIPGFLFPIACTGTMWLLNHQAARRHRGGLLEIGIFQGKYFSVLARSAQATGERLLGIDNFMYSPEAAVRAAIEGNPATRAVRLTIWSGESRQYGAKQITAALDGPARFVSVDGSHDAPDVEADLRLAEAVLADHGVVALDDYLNPRALGVHEAANVVLRAHSRLKPFALFGNKLFLARPSHRDGYKAVAEEFFAMSEAPEGHAYRNLSALGRDHVEQTLWGARLVVM